jgi:hypothetical protein
MRIAKALIVCAAGAALAWSPVASAVVSTGPGGSGVRVGQSSLIGVLDYSDTFTGSDSGGRPNRPYVAQPQGSAAYTLENTYGNPARNFLQNGTSNPEFSFAADGPGLPGLVDGSPTYPGSSGAGSDSGFTQTGNSIDYGIAYGLRNHYIVQADAVQSGDRIDITTGPTPGTLFAAPSLSVFFRGATSGDFLGNASLFNGTTDTPIRGQAGYENFNTGLTGSGQWHNYAVRFDQAGNQIEIFVDEQSRGVIDLTTFAGGIYANFSNAAVGVGGGLGAGNNRTWTDNFQVGAVPEPGAVGVLAVGLGAMSMRRRRR